MLFDFLKSKREPEPDWSARMLAAPAGGTVVPMAQLPDDLFSTGAMGACCGIEPKEGCVYAPLSGRVRQVAQTLHAVGLEGDGIKLLIHVGVDTVEMNGDGFCAKVRPGQKVEKGDLLLTMDLEKVRAAGYPDTIILAVTNSDDFAAVETVASGPVQPGDELMRVRK